MSFAAPRKNTDTGSPLVPRRKNVLDRKIKPNPKYAHVVSNIDTGATAKNITLVSDKELASRKQEVFNSRVRRSLNDFECRFIGIKPGTLARILRESEVIESVYAMTDSATSDNADWSPAASDVTATSRGHTNKTGASQKSATVHSVISSESMGWVDTSDVLLLDLRSPEDFNVAHIATAISYPAVLLARDRILPEMAKFRTSRGLGDSKGIPASIAHEKRARVMVVYDIDDRAAKNTVTAMVQKGWDEVYLLSGGFKEFSSSYPELVDGDIDSVLRSAMSRG
ncbi:Fanconi anemia group J protein [Perkinsus olseni]|uniref:Fanconi anemia group J protein n=1 Tax=Perkinsus olseni TaxID=32597 RepID=A0A7J6QGS7_PEROL|nr:Fanconi anemia group J protein [Perkinsus olseni]